MCVCVCVCIYNFGCENAVVAKAVARNTCTPLTKNINIRRVLCFCTDFKCIPLC